MTAFIHSIVDTWQSNLPPEKQFGALGKVVSHLARTSRFLNQQLQNLSKR
jgi:hypothetical protein